MIPHDLAGRRAKVTGYDEKTNINLIDGDGFIVRAEEKVKAADNPEDMLSAL